MRKNARAKALNAATPGYSRSKFSPSGDMPWMKLKREWKRKHAIAYSCRVAVCRQTSLNHSFSTRCAFPIDIFYDATGAFRCPSGRDSKWRMSLDIVYPESSSEELKSSLMRCRRAPGIGGAIRNLPLQISRNHKYTSSDRCKSRHIRTICVEALELKRSFTR